MNSVRIAPSLLSADFSRLGEELRTIDQAGADYIHLDIMDGHFVPNLTIGPAVVQALRPYTSKTFDAHLMVEKPDSLIPAFAKAGADILTIHPESTTDLAATLRLIKSFNKKAGIALRPQTSPSILNSIIDQIDLVLVMTVHPGFAGQTFMTSEVGKIKIVRALINSSTRKSRHAIDLEVDGGITTDTARLAITAGANVLVSGTNIFKDGPSAYAHSIRRLREAA